VVCKEIKGKQVGCGRRSVQDALGLHETLNAENKKKFIEARTRKPKGFVFILDG
jgi:hypothetical protein